MAIQNFALIKRLAGSKALKAMALALTLAAWLAAPSPSSLAAGEANLADAVLIHVIDGDTLKVRTGGRVQTVRLIGIDTPEASLNDKARRDSQRSKVDLEVVIKLGERATRHLESLLEPGAPLKLEFDQERHDKYGRLLAYVYRSRDNLMLNEAMLRDGFAHPYTHPPNLRYVSLFRSRAAEARANKRGLWQE